MLCWSPRRKFCRLLLIWVCCWSHQKTIVTLNNKRRRKGYKERETKNKAPIIFDFLSLGSSWSLIENLFLFSGVSVFVEMNVAVAEQKCCFAWFVIEWLKPGSSWLIEPFIAFEPALSSYPGRWVLSRASPHRDSKWCPRHRSPSPGSRAWSPARHPGHPSSRRDRCRFLDPRPPPWTTSRNITVGQLQSFCLLTKVSTLFSEDPLLLNLNRCNEW